MPSWPCRITTSPSTARTRRSDWIAAGKHLARQLGEERHGQELLRVLDERRQVAGRDRAPGARPRRIAARGVGWNRRDLRLEIDRRLPGRELRQRRGFVRVGRRHHRHDVVDLAAQRLEHLAAHDRRAAGGPSARRASRPRGRRSAAAARSPSASSRSAILRRLSLSSGLTASMWSCAASAAAYCLARASVLASVFRSRSLIAIARDVSRSVKWDPVQTLLDAVEALGFDELGKSTEGRPIRGRRFGGPGAGAAGVRRHPRRRAGERGGADRAGGAARRRDPCAMSPVWLLPAVNPDGVARGSKNSARDVNLNRNFPAAIVRDRSTRPGYFPGPAPLSEPETRVSPTWSRARRSRPWWPCMRRSPASITTGRPPPGPRPSRPRAAGRRAADIGYPTPGSLGQLAGHRSGPAGTDPRAAARAAERASASPRRPPWTSDPHRTGVARCKLLDRRAWVVFPGLLSSQPLLGWTHQAQPRPSALDPHGQGHRARVPGHDRRRRWSPCPST